MPLRAGRSFRYGQPMQGLVLRKRFRHRDGRKVLAFDGGGVWFVEARTADVMDGRRRWSGLTEDQAAGVALWLMGDGDGWADESWLPAG